MKTLKLSEIRLPPGAKADPAITEEWADYLAGNRASLSPMAWFSDVTRVPDKATEVKITTDCIAAGAIPIFDDHPMHGRIFHTLFTPDGRMSQKNIAIKFRRTSARRSGLEAELEQQVAASLANQGTRVRQQVSCSAGIADIVTAGAVYEVEYRLSRNKFFEAVGQVLLYRAAIDPAKRAVVVGYMTAQAEPLVPFANAIGVEVIAWKGR